MKVNNNLESLIPRLSKVKYHIDDIEYLATIITSNHYICLSVSDDSLRLSHVIAETVCPARIPVGSRDEKGFDILLHLNLAKKAKKTQGAYSGTRAYEVTSRLDLSEATR